ncbi:glycerophosphodiester phosphodiesterase [Halomicroarcula sp. F28]|uniref:Glycerophosphodiester phosphodiesterase n=2 Tax=Haloarcula salinisoli TaxID=2487746 RepID=A0A8J7YCR0_9EURY|nr:glycerophosphodiester phosphodiesterase [Halomicroarcula salinisoli]MBX0303007.1 glycerophosphodiester phosphodiesterase [Halomicroarcula salinisoli]
MRGAVADGADAVEIDVQPTADGDVVVFHDRRLDGSDGDSARGLTDAAGVVWEQPTEKVTAARVLGTGDPIPLLSDVLSAVPETVTVNVELKNPGSDDVRPGEALGGAPRRQARRRWEPFVESVLSVTDRFDHDVLFSSFCEGALAALDDSASTDRAAVLVAPNCAEAGETLARRYDVDAIHPPVEMLQGDPGLAATADDLGTACNAWTVRTWLDARDAIEAGADGIIADYPGLLEEL